MAMCRESASFHVKRHHACPACRGYRVRSPAPILSSTHGAVPVADFRPPPQGRRESPLRKRQQPRHKPAAKVPRHPATKPPAEAPRKPVTHPLRNPATHASRNPATHASRNPATKTRCGSPTKDRHARLTQSRHERPLRKPRHARPTQPRHESPLRKPPTPALPNLATKARHPRLRKPRHPRPTQLVAKADRGSPAPALVPRSGAESGTKLATERASTRGRQPAVSRETCAASCMVRGRRCTMTPSGGPSAAKTQPVLYRPSVRFRTSKHRSP
ncbi:hypothetical protein AXZ95_0103 [Leifsonia sp. 115AMFTsu3.1]|nr:hypothetical protein AXZ95_0103 [Leifsonia sp. 115AMFTsu3.1]